MFSLKACLTQDDEWTVSCFVLHRLELGEANWRIFHNGKENVNHCGLVPFSVQHRTFHEGQWKR